MYQIIVLLIMCGFSFILFYIKKEKKIESEYHDEGLQSGITENIDDVQDTIGINAVDRNQNVENLENEKLLENNSN